MRRRIALVVALVAVAAAAAVVLLRERGPHREPPPAQPAARQLWSAAGVSVVETPRAFVVRNRDGAWTIEKRCRATATTTVGPGYVSRLVTSDGRVLVDDEREPGPLNDPRYGGLGAFAWHEARGVPRRTRLSAVNAWEVSGRRCGARNGGFGVAAARVVRRPQKRAESARLELVVDLSDGATAPLPVARVRYRYALRPGGIEVLLTVTTLCPSGRCGRTPLLAFVKEPKVVASVTGGDTAEVVTYDASGRPVCRYAGGGPPRGPVLDTGQCGADGRLVARWEDAERCTSRPCLQVEARDPAGPWEGGSLDRWAIAAGGRPALRARDTASIDGVRWSCHAPSPAAAIHRRWETVARRRTDGTPVAVSVLFPAWEGGRGAYDCEPLSRLLGPAGETYAVALVYRLTRGADS